MVMVRRWVVWTAGVWLAVVTSVGVAAGAEGEAALRERVKAYWDARKINDLQTLYSMETATVEGRLRPDQMSRTQFSTLRIVGYSITDVRITGDKAEIKLDTEVMHPAMQGKALVGPSIVDYWTYVDGNWYHGERSKSAKGGASPSPRP
jgi:hypothetical protein